MLKELEAKAEKVKQTRVHVSSEQRAYVLTLATRLKEQLNISTLKVSRLVSKELKMNQRTVYSWLKNWN